jgi:hypothetical protein
MKLQPEEALEKLWKAKDWRASTREANPPVYATVKEPVEMLKGKIPAGSTVLVTMVSRFGDVGIRHDRLVPPSDGYYARVPPDVLTDWRDRP